MDIYDAFFAGTAILGVLGLTAVSYKTVSSPGVVTYCYIEAGSGNHFPEYTVKGNVDWRIDRTIAHFQTYESAQQTLPTCPVGR